VSECVCVCVCVCVFECVCVYLCVEGGGGGVTHGVAFSVAYGGRNTPLVAGAGTVHAVTDMSSAVLMSAAPERSAAPKVALRPDMYLPNSSNPRYLFAMVTTNKKQTKKVQIQDQKSCRFSVSDNANGDYVHR
jgi:hypothetical protein